MKNRIFISADHGLAIIYFLQSEVVSRLLAAGYEIVFLTDDELISKVRERFHQPGLIIEGLRLDLLRGYEKIVYPSIQWWLHFLRRAGASQRINLEAVNGFVNQVDDEAQDKRKILFPLMRGLISLMRRFRFLRSLILNAQNRFIPGIYADLFEKYSPKLVISATPGWRLDRYLLREAHSRGIKTATVIVGWDNSSSYSLPGAPVDNAIAWSEIQKSEMVNGSDWDPEKVQIGGIPSTMDISSRNGFYLKMCIFDYTIWTPKGA